MKQTRKSLLDSPTASPSLILFLDPDVLKAKTKILHQVQMQSLKKAARLKKGIVKMRFYPLEKVTLTLVDNKAPR